MWIRVLAVTAILSLLLGSLSAALEYYVVAANGASCPLYNISCYNLSYYASRPETYFTSDTVFSFLSGSHVLDDQEIVRVNAVTNLTLLGSSGENGGNPLAVIQCVGSGGVLCISSTSLRIIDIEIQNCSLPVSLPGHNWSAAIAVTDSALVHFESVFVTEGNGAGLLAFDVCNLTVLNCSFVANKECGLGIILQTTSAGNECSSSITQSTFVDNQDGLLVILGNVSNVSMVAESLCLSNNYTNLNLTSSSCSYSFRAEEISSLAGNIGLSVEQTFCAQPSGYVLVQVVLSDFALSAYIGISVRWQGSVEGLLVLNSVTVSNTTGELCVGIVVQEFPDVGSVGTARFLLEVTNVTVQDTDSTVLNETGQVASGFLLVSLTSARLTNLSLINNVGVGLQLFDSSVAFAGENVFRANAGLYGGGMALYGASYIILDKEVSLWLEDNHAEVFGGGIYVERSYIATENNTYFSYCFLQLATQELMSDIHFYIFNNTAASAGHVLYGGDISHCHQWNEENDGIDMTSFFVDGNVSVCANTSISSEGFRVLLCNQLCNNGSLEPVEVIPGQNISLKVAIVGQLNGTSPGTVQVADAGDVIAVDMNHFDTTPGRCSEMSFKLMLLNDAKDELTITITLANPSSLFNSVVNAHVAVTVIPCPLGFQYDSGVCACANVLKNDAVGCSISNVTVTKKPNAWIGFDTTNHCMYARKYCPFDYCKREQVSFSVPNGSDYQCQYNRSGILCGECEEGLSLILGSNKCGNCTMEMQEWSIPVVILGSFVGGLCLIVFLTVLNVTVSAGTMNGLIFFANIVKLYEPLFFPDGTSHFKYPIAWLNLELGIDTCFYAGMGSCGKMWLQFLFPLYLLSTLLVIVLLSSAGQSQTLACVLPARANAAVSWMSLKVVTIMGSNAVPVLATLCLLLYTKVLRTIVLILYKVSLDCCDSNRSNCSTSVLWYVDGSVEYSGGCHLPLLVFSVIVLLVFAIATLLMAVGESVLPWVGKRRWVVKLKPCYDAFGGPYNNQYRFWTAFLLVVRCMLALVLSINNDPVVSLDVLVCTCVFLITLLVILRVYSSAILNVLEVWFVLSLLVMAYVVETSQDSDKVSIKTMVFINITISIAMAVFFVVVTYHVYLKRALLKSALQYMDFRHRMSLKKAIVKQMTDYLTKRNDSFVESDSVDEKQLSITHSIVSMSVDERFREPLIDQRNLKSDSTQVV